MHYSERRGIPLLPPYSLFFQGVYIQHTLHDFPALIPQRRFCRHPLPKWTECTPTSKTDPFLWAWKGKNHRAASVSFKARRLLLRYKSRLGNQETEPEILLIQTIHGKWFNKTGLRFVFVRLKEESEIDFSAHTLRRSFGVLSVIAGTNPTHIQSSMGHSKTG